MQYTTHQLAAILQAEPVSVTFPQLPIVHLLIDSRQIDFPPTSVFFALVGKRHNGHHYLTQAYAKGVRAFVVSEPISAESYPEACILRVPDSLRALQQLATFHRQQFALKIIGITGSNGKTMVKEWLFQLLHAHFRTVRSPKSYNSQVGVPLSVWHIGPDHELGIFEAGISQPNEMAKLAPMIACDIGVFTNIGAAHSEGFSSETEKINEKLHLFVAAEVVIYCRDHELVHNAIKRLGRPTFTWSHHREADLRITSVTTNAFGFTDLVGMYQASSVAIQIPFSHTAAIENAIHCWAVLLYLEVQQPLIKQGMAALEPIAMRLQLIAGRDGCTLINDSYNSDLTSLAIALRFAEQQRKAQPLTLILSDILQSRQSPAELYRQVGQLITAYGVERFIGIGSAIPLLAANLPKQVVADFYPDTEAFLQALPDWTFERETILLKGARSFAFERLADRLAQQSHQTVLEVDLGAMAHNLRTYHSQLRSTTKLMAVVKAAAYGSGSTEVARLLSFHGVDYLAVAYADEGADLRRHGIDLPILVLNPEQSSFRQLIRYRLEPEVYSLPQLRQLIEATHGLERHFPIHLKLESGMHRLGFSADAIDPLIAVLLAHPYLRVQSVFSHLAASEDAAFDDFTEQQVQAFLAGYARIVAGIGYRPDRHILNSSGIARFPQYQMEMVRLGIGLYGIASPAELANQLKPVLSLKTVVSQVKQVPVHASVGYGRCGRSDHERRIATLSIGYADGLARAAGNGNYAVLLKDRRAPLVGQVCMDMCMVDVTDIPGVAPGDEAIIFGPKLPVTALAEALHTIPYEVLTGISARVKRVYIQE